MFLEVISSSSGFFDFFTTSIGIFGTIINYLVEFFQLTGQMFLNALSFIKIFFVDFIFNYINLFDFLPSVIGYGCSVIFYFGIVIFILNLLKKIPFL